MSQPLVEDDSKIDVGSKLFSGYTGVHWFIPVVIVSSREELFAKVVHSGVFF